MIRRLTVLVAATLLALILAAPAAIAGGATQISGVAFLDEADTCDSASVGADYALIMTEETGGLDGCLYTFVDKDTARSSPSGTYLETGTELFVASEGAGTEEQSQFETTYRFEAKYEDPTDPTTEIFGRCQHPIVEGSGTGIYEGVSGILLFKDEVESGTFLYRGHLRY
jgi:hypothetical protein